MALSSEKGISDYLFTEARRSDGRYLYKPALPEDYGALPDDFSQQEGDGYEQQHVPAIVGPVVPVFTMATSLSFSNNLQLAPEHQWHLSSETKGLGTDAQNRVQPGSVYIH
jgi:hypothetical protein